MSASESNTKLGLWSNLGARLRRRRNPAAESTGAIQGRLSNLKPRWNDNPEALQAVSRTLRQRKIRSNIRNKLVPFLSTALPMLSFLWLLALPLDRWGRTTYFDENAIQPGQVNTFWDWGDVHLADQWLEGIENVWNDGRRSSRE